LIMNVTNSLQIDHKDHDPLNNRRTNLRLATQSQNQHNTFVKANSKTGIKGIHRTKNGRYIARIMYQGKRLQLGYFQTSQEASEAYNKAAIKYHGEFALLNPTRSNVV
jgi:HNH endonuclease/AP2 domain